MKSLNSAKKGMAGGSWSEDPNEQEQLKTSFRKFVILAFLF